MDRKNVFSMFASVALCVMFVAVAASASTTISSNISTGGTLTVTGNVTFDTSTFVLDATNNRVGIGSTTPYVALGVTGTTTASAGMVIGAAGSPITQLLFGTCTVNPNDGPLGEGFATTTTCTATGVASGDQVVVTPSNLPPGLFMLSASSTDTNTIQVMIGATSSSSPSITTYSGWSWMAVK